MQNNLILIIEQKKFHRAVEIKNLERAEIKRKLEDIAKKELVRRIRVSFGIFRIFFSSNQYF